MTGSGRAPRSRRAPRPPGADTLIVDGFSLLHRMPEARALLEAGRFHPARRMLVNRLERAAGALADRVVVVFDGRGEGGPAEDFAKSAVDVRYSPAGTTADLVIERMVRESPNPERILVVTSDRQERDSVDAAGARHTGCGDFLDRLQGVETNLAESARATRRTAPPNPLGDWFPDRPEGSPPRLAPARGSRRMRA